MKRTLISVVCLALAVCIAKAQNDTMYVMKNGEVTNMQSLKSGDLDSIIFYKPHAATQKTVTDADGNLYQTVTIGTQTWMSENLKTTKYNDGTSIPFVRESAEWGNLSTPGYCWYKDEQTGYGNTYGGLYNWYVVETGNLCPVGWHVPSHEEWSTLTGSIGGDFIAGTKLKESGTTHWNKPNSTATNETGFTALPGGYRDSHGEFKGIGFWGGWWTSTKDGSSGNAFGRVLGYDYSYIVSETYDHGLRGGFSIRCLNDE